MHNIYSKNDLQDKKKQQLVRDEKFLCDLVFTRKQKNNNSIPYSPTDSRVNIKLLHREGEKKYHLAWILNERSVELLWRNSFLILDTLHKKKSSLLLAHITSPRKQLSFRSPFSFSFAYFFYEGLLRVS